MGCVTYSRERGMMWGRVEARQVRDGLPSRDPPHGQPGEAESGWFVKVSVRGLGRWFTYHSTAGGFSSRVLMEALNPPTHWLWCSVQLRKVIQFFLCPSREQSVLTATGCHQEAHLVFDRVIDCLGSLWFVFVLHIHTETARRGTQTERLIKKNIPSICASVHAAVLFSDRRWQKPHQSHRISLTVFSLTQRQGTLGILTVNWTQEISLHP